MNTNILKQPLNFSWVDVALEALISIQESNLKRSVINNITREIISICRLKRERVNRVDQMLEEYGKYIPHDKKQEIFKLVAETLLYIQYNGMRIKCIDDPRKILVRTK